MKKLITYSLLFMACVFPALNAYAQLYKNVFTHTDSMTYIHLDKSRKKEYKNLLLYFNMHDDSLFNYDNIGQTLKNDGWLLVKKEKKKVLIGKSTSGNISDFDWLGSPVFINNADQQMAYGQPGTPGFPAAVNYGINHFKNKPTAYKNAEGKSVFILKDEEQAQQVFISGNFNLWSTAQDAMHKTDSGWVIILDLPPGKYLYKFIVDGKWQNDPNNVLKESDGFESYNSTYFCYNYTWDIPRFNNAKKVILSGSFNNWNEKEMQMYKVNNGWKLDMYLHEGSYTYKFIVDGEWFVDPDNAEVVEDGDGNFNSLLSFGKPHKFELTGFTNAKQVVLAGSFNDWNSSELEMNKTEFGWQINYVLGPGIYSYRFVVDGNWMPDPANTFTENNTGYLNSVVIIEPNYVFKLKGYTDLQQAFITGNFNGWSEPGFPMQKVTDGWEFPIHLSPGKYIYKFVVDGKWILDPENPLYENNDYNTGNSVLWIEQDYMNK
ncbi:MAG: glycogen-binding domain-containing protein [Bacteroidetes bacterium]|nr:glycogen-binding domain-containing protein [Bacteroidota bacterium]